MWIRYDNNLWNLNLISNICITRKIDGGHLVKPENTPFLLYFSIENEDFRIAEFKTKEIAMKELAYLQEKLGITVVRNSIKDEDELKND